MEKIVIENAQENDLKYCAKLLMDVYNNNVLSEGWTIESATNICKFYFKLQPDLFFVAKSGGGVVGFTFSYIKPWADGNQLMVEEITVHEKHRKFGTAYKLCKALLGCACERYNITKVNGTTYEDEKGMPFKIYKRLGFKRIDDLFLVECDAKKLSKWFLI